MIIVVGFGFAGGVAAIEAHDAGARVLIVEKQPDPGGISVCSAGGIRVAEDAADALAYLEATNADTTPRPVPERLALGMLISRCTWRALRLQSAPALPGARAWGTIRCRATGTFGFVTVDDIPGFNAALEFPTVVDRSRAPVCSRWCWRNVRRRAGIAVRVGTAARRLVVSDGEIKGIVTDVGVIRAERAVVLASGGFEGAEELKKRQLWLLKPVRSAAVRSNTGDGMVMAQAAGAGLWHLWHYHGSYGFEHPDPAYPFGIRLKRLPDWVPGEKVREMSHDWILVDQRGDRFVNEYEPYLQDTGHRAMEHFDPVTQRLPRVPAFLLVDAEGRKLYPLSAPTWHDTEVAKRLATRSAKLDEAILKSAGTLAGLAEKLMIPVDALEATVAAWNAAWIRGTRRCLRPPSAEHDADRRAALLWCADLADRV